MLGMRKGPLPGVPKYFCYPSGISPNQQSEVRYVALLWGLSTPRAILAVGLDQKFFHLVSNCKPRRLSFQVSESEFHEVQT